MRRRTDLGFRNCLLAAIVASSASAGCSNEPARGVRVVALEGSECCRNNDDNPVPLSFSSSYSAKGDVKSEVVKGKYMRAGMEEETTDAQLKRNQDHAKQYDGPATYEVHYSITLKADKSVDTTASTVTFKKVTYSSSGTKTATGFETVAIPITGVTLGACDVLESFTFKGDKWYKNAPAGLTDKGIEGSANVKTTVTSYTAKYQNKSDGADYTYSTTGEEPKKKCPLPETKCCIDELRRDDGLPDAVECAIALPDLCEEDPPGEEPPPATCAPFDIFEPPVEAGGTETDCDDDGSGDDPGGPLPTP